MTATKQFCANRTSVFLFFLFFCLNICVCILCFLNCPGSSSPQCSLTLAQLLDQGCHLCKLSVHFFSCEINFVVELCTYLGDFSMALALHVLQLLLQLVVQLLHLSIGGFCGLIDLGVHHLPHGLGESFPRCIFFFCFTSNKNHGIDYLAFIKSNLDLKLDNDVVLLVEVLLHDVNPHNSAVHHVFVVLRDQSNNKIKKNDQEHDLCHTPEEVDKENNEVINLRMIPVICQEVDRW